MLWDGPSAYVCLYKFFFFLFFLLRRSWLHLRIAIWSWWMPLLGSVYEIKINMECHEEPVGKPSPNSKSIKSLCECECARASFMRRINTAEFSLSLLILWGAIVGCWDGGRSSLFKALFGILVAEGALPCFVSLVFISIFFCFALLIHVNVSCSLYRKEGMPLIRNSWNQSEWFLDWIAAQPLCRYQTDYLIF